MSQDKKQGHKSSRQENAPVFSDTGIVLRSYKLGEADKILRIMTRGHGKVSAVGKGVRKTSSRFGARLEPFTCLDLLIHKGRTLDIIQQAEIRTSFHELREELGLFLCASSMVELVDVISHEGQEDCGLFDLLYEYLGSILNSPDMVLLLEAAFEFRVMSNAGYELNTGGCSACGRTAAAECSCFSISAGGLVCDECRTKNVKDTGRLVRLSPEGVRLMVLISTEEPNKWPDDLKENAGQKEIKFLLDKVLEHWMERDFKSRRVLKSIPGI